MVGNGGLTFTPNNIPASVGDKVLFMWAPTTANHTVTQSTAANLCTRKDLTTSFASGSHAGAQNFSFTVMVNDTAPIWFFCAVPNHCTKGMYGVINGPPGFAFQVPNAPASGGPATPSGTGTSTNGTASAPGVSAAALSRAPAATSALFAGVLAVIAYMM
jgi:plastocyanin